MKVVPLGSPEKRRFIGGVTQSFEVQVKDRPVRTVVATARTKEDLEGVQSGIEAWLTARGALKDIVDPKEYSRIFDSAPDLYFFRIFIDRLGQVEEGWKDHHVKVRGLRQW